MREKSDTPSTWAGAVAPDERSHEFRWRPGRLELVFTHAARHPVVLSGYGLDGESAVRTGAAQPLVELMLAGDGRARTTTRFTNTAAGARLRHLDHVADRVGDAERLRIRQRDPRSGAVVETTLLAGPEHHGIRAFSELRNDGDEPLVVEAVTSLALGSLVRPGEDTRALTLYTGTGEQLAENRWSAEPLWGQRTLGEFGSAAHDQPGRGAVERIGTSTWTTARALPTGMLANEGSGQAVAWQVEHNGGWRWEVDDVRDGEDSVALLLLGPEDLDHQWAQRLAPGETFTTVPASIVFSDGGFEGAAAELTRHRRWLRRARTADPTGLLVFNDYMNTLNGDPTTARLLPLIAAAGRAGAECFCIDAGWYDDSGAHDWWPTVGEWRPSVSRFPDGGLARVVAAIRAAGMKVGLWLEPAVVGVHSPVAERLPEGAFLHRHGVRVREHDRYFLDFRHPAARAHLDDAFDALVAEFAVDYFKLDDNVTPGAGVDGAFSGGAGLLAHNRAHLEWVRALQKRHPSVVFENCASGAMRADFAMLELFDLQSTSDQVDPVHYPPIAAGAPLQILPEQSANWAYPQPPMTDEQIVFTLVTGLAGRLYLSGFLDGMDDRQLALVQDAAAVYRSVRAGIARCVPRWPAGLPQWYGDAIALRLTAPGQDLLYVWHRGAADAQIPLELGDDAAAEHLDELFPRVLGCWGVHDRGSGSIVLEPGSAEPCARIYRIRPNNTTR
ncbi:glycoside hydrolase family 36 protein [Microbacterium sp.]|uniref:glycoside hydrolase family 36 protein n=1 Tax=Microbacterium sp. TaxID=51671 RepID=UPI0039E3DBB9